MNAVAFALILILCHTWAMPDETNDYNAEVYASDEIFEAFLERFKGIMQKGDEKLEIPLLDPFTKEQSEIQINEIINLYASLTDISVINLSNYIVNSGCTWPVFILDNLTLNLTWPSVTVTTNYEELKGRIGYYEIYGDKGNIKISMENFNLIANIKFSDKEDKTHIQVSNKNVQFDLTKLDFRARGLFNNEDVSKLMSQVITDMLPQLIKDNKQKITETLENFVEKLLNDFTFNKSKFDITRMLMGY